MTAQDCIAVKKQLFWMTSSHCNWVFQIRPQSWSITYMWDGKLRTSLSFLFQSIHCWGWLLLFQWKSASSTHTANWLVFPCNKTSKFEIHWLGASVNQDYLFSELRKIPAAVIMALSGWLLDVTCPKRLAEFWRLKPFGDAETIVWQQLDAENMSRKYSPFTAK